MPAQFHQLNVDGKQFRELVPNASAKIRILSDYLSALGANQRRSLEEKLAAARTAYPEITAAMGERLFRSQNCAACHRHDAIKPPIGDVAPSLLAAGTRVKKAWLLNYLKKPYPIRPAGYHPGAGSRMPDFKLSDQEAIGLSELLSARAGEPSESGEGLTPQPLSAFSKRKAATLLTEKLSCLGCHQFGKQGGRIAPDLTRVRDRLQPDYVYRVITNPRGTIPHSVMPQVPMPAQTMELLAQFLLQHETHARTTEYLASELLWDEGRATKDERSVRRDQGNQTIHEHSSTNLTNAAQRYQKHCASCHGPSGRGDGFNARFLSVKPTLHADAAHLSNRPDSTLYDGIHSGGSVLNKSRFMPPWGATFSPNEMQELVVYLRTLCQCQAPAWSLDNRD